MKDDSELRTWLWILKTWIVFYPILLIMRIILGQLVNPTLFWITVLVGVPIVVVPVTYRNLARGGCSIKYHICPLVKGILAGISMYIMSAITDWILNISLFDNTIWNIMYNTIILQDPNQIWWFSGLAGGILTRIQEVRGNNRS